MVRAADAEPSFRWRASDHHQDCPRAPARLVPDERHGIPGSPCWSNENHLIVAQSLTRERGKPQTLSLPCGKLCCIGLMHDNTRIEVCRTRCPAGIARTGDLAPTRRPRATPAMPGRRGTLGGSRPALPSLDTAAGRGYRERRARAFLSSDQDGHGTTDPRDGFPRRAGWPPSAALPGGHARGGSPGSPRDRPRPVQASGPSRIIKRLGSAVRAPRPGPAARGNP